MNIPQSVKEIADVIGLEKTLALIESLPQCGSRSWRVCFYVPQKLRSDHHLVNILGWKDAARLVAEFGGIILQPSNGRAIKRAQRNAAIHIASQQGQTVDQIAKAHNLTARQIRNILGQAMPPEEPTK